MKKTLVITFATLSALAFSQSVVDDLLKVGGTAIRSGQARHEKDQLRGAAAKYNAEQPDVELSGQTVEVRPPRDWQSWGEDRRSWIRSNLSACLTAVNALPVWNTSEILDEAGERDSLSGNKWVRQDSMPAQGTIEVAKAILEFQFIEFQRSQDFQAWWGNWSRGGEIRLGRETSYFGLVVALRKREGGMTLAVYKTLGTASDADNTGGNISSSFFGNQVGFQLNEEGQEGRQARAMENALRQMKEVIKQKC